MASTSVKYTWMAREKKRHEIIITCEHWKLALHRINAISTMSSDFFLSSGGALWIRIEFSLSSIIMFTKIERNLNRKLCYYITGQTKLMPSVTGKRSIYWPNHMMEKKIWFKNVSLWHPICIRWTENRQHWTVRPMYTPISMTLNEKIDGSIS